MDRKRLHPQSVGAYGEKIVEAQLLRHGWVPSNVNATVKNAKDFDIFAQKNNRVISLRVKACGPHVSKFQFGGFQPNVEIATKGISNFDFTVLVNMGTNRQDDELYVVPTRVVRKLLEARRKYHLQKLKRDGQPVKDIGHWSLILSELRSGKKQPGYGIRKMWARYKDNWESLDS